MKKATLLLLFFSITILGHTLPSPRADHSVWNDLLMMNVNGYGKVDYKSIRKEQGKLSKYLIELKNHAPAEDWSKEETMAYYINLYNAYTVKFILTKYPVVSVKDVRFSGKDLWAIKLVKVGNNVFNLNHIENSILRKMKDPRIHFAINSGANSCPRLMAGAFTEKNLEASLERLTSKFINDVYFNEISPKKVKISKLFELHYQDFITNKQTLIDYINKYSKTKINANAKLAFKPYNWRLNEQ